MVITGKMVESHCGVLHYSMGFHIAVWSFTLQCGVPHCSVGFTIALQCFTLQCGVSNCSVGFHICYIIAEKFSLKVDTDSSYKL